MLPKRKSLTVILEFRVSSRRGGAGGSNDFVAVGLGGNLVRLEDAKACLGDIACFSEGHAR